MFLRMILSYLYINIHLWFIIIPYYPYFVHDIPTPYSYILMNNILDIIIIIYGLYEIMIHYYSHIIPYYSNFLMIFSYYIPRYKIENAIWW